MARVEIEPFADEHLDGAASLLAERHRRHRQAEPLLPEAVDYRAEVAGLLEREAASGVVAVRDGHVGGYLIGVRRPDEVWGPNVWIEAAGHAAEEPETVRDLYAAAAERWVDEGRTRHYALVPAADDALLHAWYRLCFGQQHAHGIRELPEGASLAEGVREADERDLDALLALDPLLPQHQAQSPVFAGPLPQEDVETVRKEIADDLASAEVGNPVAELHGQIVGNFVVVPVERARMHSGLGSPPGAAYLAWAATLPEVRGTGVGLALTDAAFAWARAHGYSTMVTDWRVTNLLSSRFWPARGFRPTFLRLYRSIP